ncbi:MAG: DegQ family serine endoprotease [Bauldia sp.]|uniref:DegQ family serine endoprotease n=1 Tax=Bauldia sp. TaxID=2575872 RepID=UPI001DE7B46E|nr:DegQ family serine endoprotease [Bauldia sp.]MCB1495797.1 DegQ family serine endoprotease [Bauldia sp.]
MAVLASGGAKSGLTRRLAGVLALGLGVAAGIQSPAWARGPESVADIAAELLDSVVNISTSQTVTGSRSTPAPKLPDGSPFQDFFDEFFDQRQQDNSDRPRRVQSLGSGFVIDSSGVIVTNNHVIDGADEITANFADGTKLTATLIGRDEKTDLAVLKVEPEKPLAALSFGDSEHLRVGDWVMAIGNPFGLGGTVTVGIVSARNRDINSGPYDNFIQTDASINRGNSGGPLFNMDGQVIGINTAIISPTGGSIGIGFAVPSSTAINVIQQLRDFGETRRGWLGVRIQEVTDEIAEGLAMKDAVGALVAGVTDPGPAAEAGIAPGDVIVKFDGRPVSAMHELPRMVADEPVGKEVEIVVIRKGTEEVLKVKLGRLEEAEAKEVASLEADEPAPADEPAVVTGPLGLSLSDLSPTLREKFGIKDEVDGVLVTDVIEGSPAAEKRVQAGDVILEISQEPVDSPEAIDERIKQLKTDGRKSALLLLANKNGDLRFVAVTLE